MQALLADEKEKVMRLLLQQLAEVCPAEFLAKLAKNKDLFKNMEVSIAFQISERQNIKRMKLIDFLVYPRQY